MGRLSFSGLLGLYEQMLSGLKTNAKDLGELPVKAADFEKAIAAAKSENTVQEDFKAKTQQSTERLKKDTADLKGLYSRLSSSVYGKYGKKVEKLEEFGLKPWKSGGRKGPGPEEQVKG
ncbi:MAG: hypothetical protein Q7K21_08010 [Elusimicrobiota bacterium]|nr:hypothetical protein [Elusimicrobiota bacterium]